MHQLQNTLFMYHIFCVNFTRHLHKTAFLHVIKNTHHF